MSATLYTIHVYPHSFLFHPETRSHVAGTLDDVKAVALDLAAERIRWHHGSGSGMVPLAIISEERSAYTWDNVKVAEFDGTAWIEPQDHTGATWDFVPGY